MRAGYSLAHLQDRVLTRWEVRDVLPVVRSRGALVRVGPRVLRSAPPWWLSKGLDFSSRPSGTAEALGNLT